MSLNMPQITPRPSPFRKRFACSLALGVALATVAAAQPVPAPTEIHSRIAPNGNEATDNRVAALQELAGEMGGRGFQSDLDDEPWPTRSAEQPARDHETAVRGWRIAGWRA